MLTKKVLHHLEGPTALSEALEKISKDYTPSNCIIVFDFDRTLTNGFADSETISIDLRIRGGDKTLQALKSLKSQGFPLFIVTARSPSRLTIEQLEASMKKCQSELSEIFLSDMKDNIYHVEKFNDIKIAWRGPLYASDYSKPTAIANILSHCKEPVALHFFDDFVGNAFDVSQADLGSNVTEVHSYWWDTYLEEIQGKIGVVYSFSSDFAYQPLTSMARQAFGIEEIISVQRTEWYVKYEKEKNIVKKPDVVLAEPKKLDLNLFAGLAIGGGGPRLLFPPKPSNQETI